MVVRNPRYPERSYVGTTLSIWNIELIASDNERGYDATNTGTIQAAVTLGVDARGDGFIVLAFDLPAAPALRFR